MPKIEVLYCVLDGDILHIAEHLPPPRPDVAYLVAWQQRGGEEQNAPGALLQREDVKILAHKSIGLSKNRNFALANATGDLLILADADNIYIYEYFDRLLAAAAAQPEADILLFQAITPEGNLLKNYPEVSCTYADRPRGCSFSSCDIVLRRSAALPRFDERFGLGAAHLSCGEEEIFLEEASRGGCRIVYTPQTIVTTRAATTGDRFWSDPKVRRAKGAVLCYMHGAAGAALRCLKFAAVQGKAPLALRIKAFLDMAWGIWYSFTTSARPLSRNTKPSLPK